MKPLFLLFLLFVLSPFVSFAQQKGGETPRSYAERIAKENGLIGAERENYIDFYLSPNKYNLSENREYQTFSSCGASAGTNIGFELGNYTDWVFSGGTNLRSITDSTAFSLTVGTKTILSGGTDPISSVSLTSPLGGTKIIKLNDNISNAQVTAMKTKFKVTPSSSLLKTASALVYQYAGHKCNENPYFKIQILNCDETVVLHEYYSLNLDGSCRGINYFAFTGAFTPWNVLCFDLSPYLGQVVVLKVAVGDCIYTGHYAYAYFDAGLYPATGLTITNTLLVNSIPYSFTTANFNNTCFSNPLTISAPSGATSYSWATPTTSYAVQSFTTSNEGYHSVAITNTAGCRYEKHFMINLSPTVSILSATNAACANTFYTLSASGANTYTWLPTGSTNTVISLSSTSSITHTLIGYSPSKVCTNTVSIPITVYPNPTISVSGNASVCIGSSITIGASGANTYTWSTGANTASTVVSPTANTIYTVNGTDIMGCNGSANSMWIQAIPTNTNVYANTASSSICLGDSVYLVASAGQSSYLWSSGATTYTTYVKPTSTTIYSVSIGSTCGPVTRTVQVNVNSPVGGTLTVTSPATVCLNTSFPVSAAGFSSYTYTFGTNNYSGSSISAAVPSLTVTNFSVTATDAGGCKTTSVFPISAAPLPTLSISGPTLICSWQVATLTASGANTYTWTNSSLAVLGTGPTFTASPPSLATYYLFGTDANGCSGPYINHTVRTEPTLVISSSPSVCSGGTLSLGTNFFVSPTTYSWSTGATTSVIISSPTTTTTYTLEANNSLCGIMTATTTVTVSATPSPTVTITASSPTACAGTGINLTASGASSYTWSTGSNFPTIYASSSVAGNVNFYVIGASASGTCKSLTPIFTVTFIPSPTVSIVAGSSVVCSGSSTTLTANGSSGSYTWSTGSNLNSISVTPVSSPTTYSVVGSYTNGCTSSATKLIYVQTIPSLSINCTNNPVCPGVLTEFYVYSADYYNFLWSNGSTQDTAWVAPTTTTSYSCTSFGPYNCNNTQVITITVTPTPSVSLTAASYTLCPYPTAPLTLNPNPPGGTYITPGITSNTVYLYAPGTYSISYKITSPCTVSTTAVFTVVPQQCVLTSASPDSVCVGQSSSITYTPGGGSLSGPFLSGNIFTPTTAGSYSVNYTYIDTYGCPYTECESITVNLCTGVKEQEINALEIFPNPFSNEFTINNPQNLVLTISVYDLNGKLIRNYTADKTTTFNTENYSEGIYYLHISSKEFSRFIKLIKL